MWALRLAIALLGVSVASCGGRDFIWLDEFARWCGGAPCGWELVRGEISQVDLRHRRAGGVELSGVGDTVLRSKQPIDIHGLRSAHLVVMADVDEPARLAVRVQWIVDTVREGVPETRVVREDSVEIHDPDPSYLYLPLQPPPETRRFYVELHKIGAGAARIAMIAVTTTGPLVSTDVVYEGGWVGGYYVVDADVYGETFEEHYFYDGAGPDVPGPAPSGDSGGYYDGWSDSGGGGGDSWGDGFGDGGGGGGDGGD